MTIASITGVVLTIYIFSVDPSCYGFNEKYIQIYRMFCAYLSLNCKFILSFSARYTTGVIFSVLALGGAVLLYLFYAKPPQCIENKVFICANLGVCLIVTVLSVTPCLKKSN